MTIQRQYILPNCSLILEGLSTDPSSQVLSILANAECKIVGIDQPLSGGLEFFKALVKSVSQYAQGILSGLPHPQPLDISSGVVQIKPDTEGPYHYLQIKRSAEDVLQDGGSQDVGVSETESSQQTPARMTDVKLSTVQLFDLAEAIDQFFADTQTLPDLQFQLAPLSRRFVKSSEPLTQRVTPPLLGISAVALAALGFFFLPVPEVPEIDPTLEQSELQSEALTEETSESPPGASPENDSSANEATAATTEQLVASGTETKDQSTAEASASGEDNNGVETLPQIEDQGTLAKLQGQLTRQLQEETDTQFDKSLLYRVTVAENGDVVGYKSENDAALANIDNTPLPQLTYIPLDADEPVAERVAQFRVMFAPNGAVEVSPWTESNGAEGSSSLEEATIESESSEDSETDTSKSDSEADSATVPEAKATEVSPATVTAAGTLSENIAVEIESREEIATLNAQLRQKVARQQGQKTFPESLVYRVRVAENGTVVGYEAEGNIAEAQVEDTPFPSLVETVNVDMPQVDFRVAIQSNGVVEVSPWRGWR